MKLFLISDNVDTATGLRLSGVEGVVVHTATQLSDALSEVLADPEIGILLVTELLEREFSSILNDFKSSHSLPLVVEIPDRHGTGRKTDFITDYVSEAIGLKL